MLKTLHIPVAEIMSRDLFVVKAYDTLERVSEIFRANNIHHIPVVKENGALAGIVSKSDFLKVNRMLTLFNAGNYHPSNEKLYENIKVGEIMTRQLATLSPDDPVSVASGIFMENLFHALPVVDRGTLVGLVTTHDLIGYLCSDEAYLE